MAWSYPLRDGETKAHVCTAVFPTKPAVGENCPWMLTRHPILPPSYPIPIPTHSIPSQFNPSQLNPSHPILTHPNPSYGSPSPGYIGRQPTMLGTLRDVLLPLQTLYRRRREGLTAPFVYWGALQGQCGLDPTWHSSCRVCTQNFCFPVQKELLHSLFCVGHEREYRETGKDSCCQ